MSIYIEQILKTLGFNFDSRIKLVRHVEQGGINLDELISNDQFDFYQAYQFKPIFDNTDWILTFLADKGKRAIFHGAYEVLGITELVVPDDYPHPEHFNELKNFQYDLRRDESFDIFQNTGLNLENSILISINNNFFYLINLAKWAHVPRSIRNTICQKRIKLIKKPNHLWGYRRIKTKRLWCKSRKTLHN